MTERLISESPNSARSSAVISGTTLVATMLGGFFALAVTWIIGAGAETDGFFAAYSAYTAFIVFGTSMRVALVPQLGPASEPEAFRANATDVVARLIPLALVLCAVFVLAAPVIGYALTLDADPRTREVAIASIALLSIAAFFQIWAAVVAAVLGGAKRFVATSLASMISLAVSVTIGAILLETVGILGASVGMIVGAATYALAQVVYLRRLTFSAPPKVRAVFERRTWLVGGRMAIAAVLPIVIQLYLTMALAAISATEGAVTAYTYGYLIATVLSAVSVGTVGVVSMPAAVDAVHREGSSAAVPFVKDVGSVGFFLFWPLAICFALFGKPVVDALFGGSLSASEIEVLWNSSRLFMVLGVVWAVGMPFTTYALAMHLYSRVAVSAFCLFLIHALTMFIFAGDDPTTVAAIHVGGGVALFLVLSIVIMGATALRAWAAELKAIVVPALLGLSIVAIELLFGSPGNVGAAIALSAAGCAAYAALSYFATPNLGRKLIGQLLQRAPGSAAS